MRTKLVGVAAAVAIAAGGVALGPTASRAALPVGPTPTITPLDADAGLFRAEGECPAKTTLLRFQWKGAPNRTGYGEISIPPGPYSLVVRMQAAAPGGTIEVTIDCRRDEKKVVARFAPVTLVSGNSLLPLPEGSGTGRRVVYSLAAQQVWAVDEDGTVARTYLVSGRRKSLIREKSQLGTFNVISKSRFGCAAPVTCPNMVRFHETYWGVIGFHAIPYTKKGTLQERTELGQPRSHGCVRSAPADASWLYSWIRKGDVVVVVE